MSLRLWLIPLLQEAVYYIERIFVGNLKLEIHSSAS